MKEIHSAKVMPDIKFRDIPSLDVADRLTRHCGACESMTRSWNLVNNALVEACIVNFSSDDINLTDDNVEVDDLSNVDGVIGGSECGDADPSCCADTSDTYVSWMEQFLPRVKVSQAATPHV